MSTSTSSSSSTSFDHSSNSNKRKADEITPDVNPFASTVPLTVNQIDPLLNDSTVFCIKGRVSWKSPLNNGAYGKSFFIHIVDKNSDQIRINFATSSPVEESYEALEYGKVYIFSRAVVKKTSTVSGSYSSPYAFEIEMTAQSTMIPSEAASNDEIPLRFFSVDSILPFDKVSPFTTNNLCIAGIIVGFSNVQEIRSAKSPIPLKKIDFCLCDHNHKVLMVSAWSDALPIHSIAIGDMVVLEQLRVSTYQNNLQLSLSFNSTMYKLTRDMDESLFNQLASVSNTLPSIDFLLSTYRNLSRARVFSSQNSAAPIVRKTIAEIFSESIGAQEPTTVEVEASVKAIETRYGNLYYEGCPTCRKKLTSIGLNAFQCNQPKCGGKHVSDSDIVVSYSLPVIIGDTSGKTMTVRAFGAEAVTLMCGVSAQAVRDNVSNPSAIHVTEYINKVIQPTLEKKYLFKIKAASNENPETKVSRVQYNVVSVTPLA